LASTQATGKYAEDLALAYLTEQGLQLVTRNFTSRYGEIDLIMQDRDCLVFVEVRYRTHHQLVDGVTSIDTRKQNRLLRTARYYLQVKKVNIDTSARFDIISITHKQDKTAIEWLQNAFAA